MKKIKNINKIIIAICIISVPLIFLPNCAAAFTIPKITLLRLFSIILIILFCVYLFKGGSILRTKLDWVILLLLIINILSTIYSVNPFISFIGSYERQEGLLTFFSYLIIFYAIVNFLNKKDTPLFLNIMIIVANIVAVYGIIQAAGLDPLPWQRERFFVCSTVGNRAFLSAYLLLILPILIALLFQKKNKLFYFISFLLIYTCFILGRTRACLVAFVPTIFVLLLLLGKKRIINHINMVGALSAAMIIIGIYFMVINKGTAVVDRFTKEMFEVEQTQQHEDQLLPTTTIKPVGSVKDRLEIWSTAIRIIKDYPLFGVGLDTMDIIFKQYKPLEYVFTKGQYTGADRAHNEILDNGVAKGLPGIIIYFVFLFYILKLSRKIYKENLKEEYYKLFIIGFVGGIVGFYFQNLFSFGELVSNLTYWSLIGLVFSLSKREKFLPNTSIKLLLCFIFLCFSALCAVFIYKLYVGDVYYKKAKDKFFEKNFEEAIRFYNIAVKHHPTCEEYRGSLIKAHYDRLDRRRADILAGIKLAKEGLKFIPQNSIFYNLLGMGYYYLWEVDKNKELIFSSIKAYNKAIYYDAHFIDAYNNLGASYIALEDYDKAIINFEKVFKLSNKISALHTIGFLYYKKQDYKNAENIFIKIINDYPDYDRIEEVYNNLALMYKEKNLQDKAIRMYKELIKINDRNIYAYENLADLYIKKGKLKEAVQICHRILEIDKNNLFAKALLGF